MRWEERRTTQSLRTKKLNEMTRAPLETISRSVNDGVIVARRHHAVSEKQGDRRPVGDGGHEIQVAIGESELKAVDSDPLVADVPSRLQFALNKGGVQRRWPQATIGCLTFGNRDTHEGYAQRDERRSGERPTWQASKLRHQGMPGISTQNRGTCPGGSVPGALDKGGEHVLLHYVLWLRFIPL